MPKAAVCNAFEKPVEVMPLTLDEPRAGEVKVRMRAAAVCASDVSLQAGNLPKPLAIPVVLGHQGVGEITAVGDDVEGLTVGDRVVIVAMPQCGTCARCSTGRHYLCPCGDDVLSRGVLRDGTSRLHTDAGVDIAQMSAVGTFAEEIVVSAISTVRIAADMPFIPASLLGCAGLTGAGAALNTASIKPGDRVVVLGCGTVGLNAIFGAKASGASQIVAVDLLPRKLELAKEFGATAAVSADREDVLAAVGAALGGQGADVTIEAAGAQATVDWAPAITARGGETVFVSAGGRDVRINVRQYTGLTGPAKTFKGSSFGSAHVQQDIPRLVAAYTANELKLDSLVTDVFSLDQVNEALVAAKSADTVTAVIEF